MNFKKILNILRHIIGVAKGRFFGRVPDHHAVETLPDNDSQDVTSPANNTFPTEEATHDSNESALNDEAPVLPQDMGGRRTSGGPDVSPKPPAEPKPPSEKPHPEAKPALVCREMAAGNQWDVLLVLPSGHDTEVYQGESMLETSNGREFSMVNLTEMVRGKDGGENYTIPLFDNTAPLIFKLGKNWRGDGRKVEKMSTGGHYIALTPTAWKRKGTPPIETAYCRVPEFSVHYFFIDNDSALEGFSECAPFFSGKRFLLEGDNIEDDSDKGTLFVGASPRLKDDDDKWENVSWVRVGEEGGGIWRENFKPTKTNIANVVGEREGWFYVRIYDSDVQLIESFDFRRSIGLKEILVDEKPHSSGNIMTPGETGHTKTKVHFIGENISATSEDGNSNPHVTMTDDNVAVIAPHPDADRTCWMINEKTEVVIQLPRVWWRMEHADNQQGEWRDTVLQMSRDEFRDNRNKKISTRLPLSAKEICVGFKTFYQSDGARIFPARYSESRNEKQAEFDVRNFVDHQEISNHSKRMSALRIRCDEIDFPIVKIAADESQDATSSHTCNDINRSEVEVLCPATKNKRFSMSELQAAELTEVKARRLNVKIDRRRRTKHVLNIDKLLVRIGENHAN